MPTIVNDNLFSWASDPGPIRQAEKTARLPILDGHVARMPDAHVGIGATVGSVIPTKAAVIPAAVGSTVKRRTPTSRSRCATVDRPGRVHGSHPGAVHVANSTRAGRRSPSRQGEPPLALP